MNHAFYLTMLMRVLTCVGALFLVAPGYSQAEGKENRVDAFLEEKMQDYRRGVAQIELEHKDSFHKLEEEIIGKLEKEITRSCQNGRLDEALLYLAVKTNVELGLPLETELEVLSLEKRAMVEDYAVRQEKNTTDSCGKIDDVNKSLYLAARALLEKARGISRSLTEEEFNDLVAFVQQFPLPPGAVMPSDEFLVGGLKCSLYRGQFSVLDDIKEENLRKTFFASGVSLLWGVPEVDLGLKWEGLYYVANSGMYEFSITSDDGSRVTVNGERIIENDGGHVMRNRKGKIHLERGWTPILIEYFQARAEMGLVFEIGQVGIQEPEPVPANYLAGKK